MSRLRGILIWLFVGAGLAATSYSALTFGTEAVAQARLSEEVRTLLGSETIAATPPAPSEDGTSSGTVSDGPLRATVEGQVLGLIQIPSIGLDVAFLEGVSDGTLRLGPGHLRGTALPGGRDVSVVAAHRDSHFRQLKDVGIGDPVVLQLPSGPLVYRVTARTVVDPDDRWVTAPRGRPMLRLVTCWPPNHLGPAPDRLVVTAIPESSEGPPAASAAAPRPPNTAVSATTSFAVAAAPGTFSTTGSLPGIGVAGATTAGLAAFGAFRTRRRLAWWFVSWIGGVSLLTLSFLASWAGPALIGLD
jgi:sortase A